MNWFFWRPKHTVQSVAQRIAAGLRDGSIMLDEPLEDEPFDDVIESSDLVLQLDIPQGTSNEEILELVKQCVIRADEQNRLQGGQGLTLEAVRVESPKIRVALRQTGPTEKVNAV